MNPPSANTVFTTGLLRYGLSLSAAAALLGGCGGSRPLLSDSPQGFASQQSLGQQAYNILHEFGVSPDDGKNPSADLINVKGTLYGTTLGGGSHIYGTVFKITKTGQETVLHSFGAPGDGVNPAARLLNVNGTLYGTTASGGSKGGGTVFSIKLDGTEKIIYDFDSTYGKRDNGYGAVAGLIDVDGTLYGTTEHGGVAYCGMFLSCGTVFSITMSGKYKVLHRFGHGYDGANPKAALLDVNGTLYGTTSSGGRYNYNGTVFSITTTGQYRTVYNFGTSQGDGGYPAAALINVNGTLYGTAAGEGRNGAVFSITTDGTEKTIYNFAGSNGSNPVADLVYVKGVLYGTTAMGGKYNVGTVFGVTTSGEEILLHSFHAGGGENPQAGLLEVDGTLYGTTYGIVRNNHGNVFSLKP
ncbi:MAG: choice-of-anchor tandem repeat GloVer-containing protein [Candidatus Tumulicola sp.]